MASNYGTTTHRSSSTNPNTNQNNDEYSKSSTSKYHYTFSIYCPFNIPSTPESAAARILKNLVKFGIYYAIFVWTVLFITLVPKRKVSVIYLVATTEVTFLYSLMLREFPNFVLLHKIIDKRIVLFFLFLVASIEMILTKAGIHLFATLAATIPIVILHAVLSRTEEVFVSEEDTGEMVSLVQPDTGEMVSLVQPENLV